MAKLKLGSPPKTFKQVVEVPLLDGDTAEITFDFKYRTRKEFGAFVDGFLKESTTGKKKKETEITLTDILSGEDEANAKYIMQIADGWDLEDSFNETSVMQLITEYPSANLAIGEAYMQALMKGRAKN